MRSRVGASTVRAGGLLLAAVALAALHVRRPATVCVLRAVTGVPCPFCGGTTAAVDVGHGHVLRAVQASPVAVLGSAVFVASPSLPSRWRLPSAGKAFWVLAVTIGGLSELWQLHRFGLL